MKEQAGRIIDIVNENRPVPGCTISKQIYHESDLGISIFSLASGTSISAENYEYHKLWMVYDGEMDVEIIDSGRNAKIYKTLSQGYCIITPTNVSVGVKANIDSTYIEIELGKERKMNEILKAGNVFKLGELIPYQEGKIVNMDLINNENLKFVIMSFDEGTGLSEHAAPGEALVFALDGEAVIGYEGENYRIKAGETFKFDKLGKHSVSANGKFKMGLLLLLN